MPSSATPAPEREAVGQHHFYVSLQRTDTSASTSVSDQFYPQLEQIKAMADFKLTTLFVDYQHLMHAREILARAITDQYYR